MTGKHLIKILKKYGWTVNRVRGSHHILVNKGKRSIPVPVHGNKDLPPGLINAIIKQAGLKKNAIT